MTAYRSAGNTRQVKVESGAMNGAPYDVTINKSTVENVVGNPKITAAELAVLKNLDAIVKNSTYVESSKSASLSSSNQPIQHDYFETPVTLGGETYIVRLDVAVKKSSANIKPQSVVEGIEVVRAQDAGVEKMRDGWNSAETTSGKDLPKWPETFEELLVLPEKPHTTPGELPDLASNGWMGYTEGAGDVGKIPWDNWNNYEKVTANGQEYAKVGDRLYSKHAVDRMQPSGNRFGANIYQAGGDYGRSVAPQFVEDVLSSVKPVLQENGNLSYKLGTLEIITNSQGYVVTIMTYR